MDFVKLLQFIWKVENDKRNNYSYMRGVPITIWVQGFERKSAGFTDKKYLDFDETSFLICAYIVVGEKSSSLGPFWKKIFTDFA